MSLTTGLVSDWSFDGASGANETDNGSGGNTLTEHASPGSGTGLISNARTFVQGSSQYFQAPSGIISGYGDWTISIWFKPSSTALASNWPRVIDWGTGTGNYLYFTVRESRTGHAQVAVIGFVGAEFDAPIIQALVAGTWYHAVLACTVNGITVYLNGVAVSGVAGQNAQGSHLAPTLCYLGKSQFADPYYDGSMDQANLWSRALSAQEVQALYNGGAGLAFASLGGATIPAAPTPNAYGRAPYQMSSFDGNTETLLMHESYDLVVWTSYIPTYTPTSGTVRDTSIMLYRGVAYIAHTMSDAPGGSNGFMVAKSSDYTFSSFSSVVKVDCSSVTGATGGTCWAPEWVKNIDGSTWLDGSGRPSLLVACNNSSADSGFAIYEVHPNSSDPTTWGTAANWSAPAAITGTGLPTNAIDPYLALDGSTWRLMCKDETARQIVFLTSTTGPTSGFNTATTDPGNWGTSVEAPCLIKPGSTYYMFADRYSIPLGIGYATSPDMSTISVMAGLAADTLPRHGTVIPAPVGGLFRQPTMTGLGAGGPFFANPIG